MKYIEIWMQNHVSWENLIKIKANQNSKVIFISITFLALWRHDEIWKFKKSDLAALLAAQTKQNRKEKRKHFPLSSLSSSALRNIRNNSESAGNSREIRIQFRSESHLISIVDSLIARASLQVWIFKFSGPEKDFAEIFY